MKFLTCYSREQSSTQGTDRVQNTGNSSFLLLPYELRHEIYHYSLIECRHPPAEIVYQSRMKQRWEDRPSPLLGVNQQIRAEIFDFLQRSPFTLRITWQDKKFDSLALSAFIAQQRFDRSDIPHLVVEVWPPASDRPIDTLLVWANLQLAQEELRARWGAWRVSRFDLVFLENDMEKWSTPDGTPWCWTYHIPDVRRRWTPWNNDLICMLSLFNYIHNMHRPKIEEVHISLPASLLADGKNMGLRDFARQVEQRITGRYELNRSSSRAGWPDPFIYFDSSEWFLRRETALIARDRLDALTNHGRFKISEAEWNDFTAIWPHFETLQAWWPEGGFRGKWHYTEACGRTRRRELSESSSSPLVLLQELPFYEG